MEKQVLMKRYKNHFDMLTDVEAKIKHNLWERGLISDADFHEIKQGLFKAEAVIVEEWDELRYNKVVTR
jgi:hypothetical protein